MVITGLKKMQEAVAPKERQQQYDGPQRRFVTVADGQSVRLRFLQELDEDSPGYNEKAGTGFLAVEHRDPKDFKKRVECTIDSEGVCWACDQHKKNWKAGWKQKTTLYVNVLLLNDAPEGEDQVAILKQGNGPKTVVGWLLEYAGDNGTITDSVFKLKRTGTGLTDTSYQLTPGKTDTERFDVSQYELIDLDSVLNRVPSAEMAAYFGYDGATAPEESTSAELDW